LVDLKRFVQSISPTRRAYLEDSYSQALNANVLRFAEEKNNAYIAVDQTIFHPRSGGQPSDRGALRGSSFRVDVKRAMLFNEVIVHYGKVEGKPDAGAVVCEIDWPNRLLLMRRHTAAHLLDYCLATLRRSNVETTDSWLGDQPYVGYAGPIASNLDVKQVEELANSFIRQGRNVRVVVVNRTEAERLIVNAPNISRLPQTEELRVVTIEGQLPIPCGGTHVRNLREIEVVEVRRIEPTESGFRLYFEVK